MKKVIVETKIIGTFIEAGKMMYLSSKYDLVKGWITSSTDNLQHAQTFDSPGGIMMMCGPKYIDYVPRELKITHTYETTDKLPVYPEESWDGLEEET